MKSITPYLIVLLLSSCNLKQKGIVNEQILEIENQLDLIDSQDGYSGTVLIAQHGKILLEKAYGFANLADHVPNNTDTKFNIASMGKMFTAVGIMQLKEQEKLDLNSTVGEILPDYPNETVRNSVTIKQLLGHTSGLSDFFNDEFEFRAKHTVKTLDDYFSMFKNQPLLFSPGSKYSYSNSGYIVLGMIIEKLSGVNYYDYAINNIFLPAGMKNTDCFETDSSIENLAEGYIKKDKKGVWKTSTYMKGGKGSSAGGAYSTTNDLFNFTEALKSDVLISKESLDLMTTTQSDNEYGYGFCLNEFNDIEVYGHNGGAYGVSGELDIYKDLDFVVVTLSNKGPLDGWVDVRTMIRKTLAGSTSETDRYVGSKELIEIYKSGGYEAAFVKLESLEESVSEKYLMDAANKYREAKEYDKAIDLLKLLVTDIPNSWYSLSILADTYLEAGNQELAINNYQKSLELEPENTWAIEKLELLNKS